MENNPPIQSNDTMEPKYRGINLKPADNGGFVLEYYTYTEHLKMSHCSHKEHLETFEATEEDKAMARVVELHKGNLEHYKKNSKKKSSHNSSH